MIKYLTGSLIFVYIEKMGTAGIMKYLAGFWAFIATSFFSLIYASTAWTLFGISKASAQHNFVWGYPVITLGLKNAETPNAFFTDHAGIFNSIAIIIAVAVVLAALTSVIRMSFEEKSFFTIPILFNINITWFIFKYIVYRIFFILLSSMVMSELYQPGPIWIFIFINILHEVVLHIPVYARIRKEFF